MRPPSTVVVLIGALLLASCGPTSPVAEKSSSSKQPVVTQIPEPKESKAADVPATRTAATPPVPKEIKVERTEVPATPPASPIQLVSAPTAPAAPTAGEVTLRVVKYQQLIDAVKAQKGKIIVVDIWADFCLPCKKEFPHLVELHKHYGKDGVVCISVTIDELENKDAALKFLKSKGATFANYLLDEDASVWQNKWMLKGVPAVFVFNREGKRAAKFDNDDPDKQFTYLDVEKLVRDLLRE